MGSEHDLTIAREAGLVGLFANNEVTLADKAYVGTTTFVCPLKKSKKTPFTEPQKIYNSSISKPRALVENYFV
eukprot:gene13430-15826_t